MSVCLGHVNDCSQSKKKVRNLRNVNFKKSIPVFFQKYHNCGSFGLEKLPKQYIYIYRFLHHGPRDMVTGPSLYADPNYGTICLNHCDTKLNWNF